jgi:outer membrane protein
MSFFPQRVVMPGLLLLACALAPARAQPTDLLELYTRATEFDPAYQTAQYRTDLAREVMRDARSGLKPSISANVDTSNTWQNIRESDNILFQEGTSDFVSQTYSISLTQPVYNPDALVRVPQARAVERRAAAEFAAAEQDLIFRLAQAHFTYLAALDGVEFATAERIAIEKQLRESQERLDSGLGRITAVHEARARFSLAQAAEIEAQDALDQSRRAIAEITGTVPVDLAVLGESFPLVGPDQPDIEVWVEAALFQNPSIQALQEAVEVEDYEIRRQRGNGHRPRLDLVTAFNDEDSGGTIFGGGNEITTTNVALRLAIPLYDGGRTSASTRTAVLQKQIRIQDLETERRRVERETRDSFQGVLSEITRVKALRQSVFSQEAALAAKQEELRAGLATRLEVLDITKDLFSARRDLSQARYLYILNSLKLKQAAGILGVDDLRQINAYLQ